jgi:DNA recombination protein RmuC
MEALLAILAFVVGGALGAVAMRFFAGQQAVSRSKFDALHVEKEILVGKVAELNANNAQLNQRHEETHTELRQTRDQLVRLQTENRVQEEKLQQHRADLEQMEKKARESFENLAGKIFDAQATKFNENSKEKLGGLLAPLQKQLQDFQQKVDEHVKDQFSLKKEIENIVLTNQKMSQDTANLADALRGNSKTQGDWGELVLDNILEASGLRKNDDYVVQGAELGLKNVDHGRTAKPDVVVKLPDGKHIIIDSKVSLAGYEAYYATDDDAQKAIHLGKYLASVRKHAAELHDRGYQHIEKLGTPDFVLMFVPTEGAYALAMQQDKDLHNFAWNKKIVIVCPSTLFATLRTVECIWRIERQNQNAVEIAKRGGSLYDKIAGFVDDMQKLGQHMDRASGMYDAAMNKLSSGRGNILAQAENLRELGAKTTKKLPGDVLKLEDSADNAEVIDLAEKMVS